MRLHSILALTATNSRSTLVLRRRQGLDGFLLGNFASGFVSCIWTCWQLRAFLACVRHWNHALCLQVLTWSIRSWWQRVVTWQAACEIPLSPEVPGLLDSCRSRGRATVAPGGLGPQSGLSANCAISVACDVNSCSSPQLAAGLIIEDY
jgi:hypothetical protein